MDEQTATLPENLIDACVMECDFREHIGGAKSALGLFPRGTPF